MVMEREQPLSTCRTALALFLTNRTNERAQKSHQIPTRKPRVFMSYSHDSREHEEQVRALVNRLRVKGIEALLTCTFF
jgi:hypothetical protein